MKERIIEIIIYLLEQFRQAPDKNTDKDLSKELLSRGYTDNEINLAFSWVSNHLQSKTADSKINYSLDSDLVLDDLEKLIISPEAYGYLLQLYHLGMLKEYDLEDVIDRALLKGSNHVTLDDVKAVAASLIFNSESGSDDNFFFQGGTDSIH